MSQLYSECLHSIYRGSLSSSAHSFKRIAGNRSVPGAELFLMSLIALIMDCFVKSTSHSLGPVVSSSVEKKSFVFSILKFGSA